MRREDINYAVSFLLFALLIATGATGYMQSALELRNFVPHRWFGYSTLITGAIHIGLNTGRSIRYLKRKFKKTGDSFDRLKQ